MTFCVTLPLTGLIHKNLSVVMTFAFSRVLLEQLRERRFPANWKYLDKALFRLAEQRAIKACIDPMDPRRR